MSINLKCLRLIFLFSLTLLFFRVHSQDYFQQRVNYTINVRLDDQKHFLHGFEKIEYINNSPNELNFIYFHLWPNAYKNNDTELAKEELANQGKHHLFNIKSQRGYIDSLNFKANGNETSWEYHPEHIDICKVHLNQPLKSGEKVIISTPFRVKIPSGVISRFGHIRQAYKITQWYPKPAVYDNRGWHPMPYRDMGEFYSEFGSFRVSITLPQNYVVAASGNLASQTEIDWLNKQAELTEKKLNFSKEPLKFPTSHKKFKTITYHLDNAHDFAWFADKRFLVKKDEVQLPNTGKKVTSWSFFNQNEEELWMNANEYINDALRYYSKWYGNYPYDHCSAVSGISTGGGMEYPTITIIGPNSNAKSLEQVIMHEVGHNWFYGTLGFNERRYPYLDEGLNTFSEVRYINEKYKDNNEFYQFMGLEERLANFLNIENLSYARAYEMAYLFLARRNFDQPMNTHSCNFTRMNYGVMSYMKAARAFHYLQQYLGEEKFDQVMSDFYRKWKFKHPYPEDLEVAFSNQTEKELDWFFHGMTKTNEKVDYKIIREKDNKILVKNKENLRAPLVIYGFKDGQEVFSEWYKGFKEKKWLKVPAYEVDKYVIDPNNQMLELYRNNNTLRSGGLFKRVEPLRIQAIGLLDDPNYSEINMFPILGWNNYDNVMISTLFYNSFIPPGRFHYFLSPSYSTGNNKPAGAGSIFFDFYPDNLFQKVQFKLSGKQYGVNVENNKFYNKIQTELNLTLQKKPAKRFINRIQLGATYLTKIEDILSHKKQFGHQFMYHVKMKHNNSGRSINPYSLQLNTEFSERFVRTSFEANYELSYYMNKGLKIRLFGGAYHHTANNLPGVYSYHLSGLSGFQDYNFENVYLGRFENPYSEIDNQLLSQQFYPKEGAFKLYSGLGITQDWLVALNLSTPIPLIDELPVEAYGSIGAFGNSMETLIPVNNNSWAFETGIKFSFLNLVNIYFPGITSNNLDKASKNINTLYWERIRFHLHFDIIKLNEIMDQINAY